MSDTLPQRFPLLAGALLGATGVALGALGAHRLEPLLAERGMTHAWETGARYHLYHALALLAITGIMARPGVVTRRLTWAARGWTLGTLLFSGSLYWFALGGPRPLVYVTPLGGLALLTGWALAIAAALARRNDSTSDRP